MTMISNLQDTLGIKQKSFSLEKVQLLQKGLNEKSIDYLQRERGLSTETIENFKLGYDEEKDAISIPHFKRGEVVSIKYRFLNSENEKRYGTEKGGQNWFFNEDGINVAREKGGILVTEGEFDAMSAWQSGFKNVIGVNGSDATGTWVENLQSIPKIYLAYDNDLAGKRGSKKFAERLGTDKCFEVSLEEKDLNDFFKVKNADELKRLLREAKPFYKYQFQGISDIIENFRNNHSDKIVSQYVPYVKFEKDWLVTVSAGTNVGKTSYVLNIANEMTNKGVPTLIMPFEGGIDFVGKRFLQVKFNKTEEDFEHTMPSEWSEIIESCIKTPVYFTTPKRQEITDTMKKAKLLFDTQIVIVDHLDYLVRNVQGNRSEEIANTLQELKRFAEENKILVVVVSHVRKMDVGGASLKRKPTLNDLKGSSSIEQDSQVVIMLNKLSDTELEVDVQKNKGAMGKRTYEVNLKTGKIIKEIDEFSDFKI